MPGKSVGTRPGTCTNARSIAIIGPQSSGKTSLLEAILSFTGALDATSQNGAHVFGDFSPEAKARGMSTEVNIATTEFMGDRYTFFDCPGSIELMQETLDILPACDAAILVTETDTDKIVGLTPLLRGLEDLQIPRYVFANKVDLAGGNVQELAAALQDISQTPVILRHIPVIKGEQGVTGYIDLAHERAYIYSKNGPSEIVNIPENQASDADSARYTMLETLADYDDHLMEELLEDITPPKEEVYQDLAIDVQKGLVVPVLIGSATQSNGIQRLLKALRHEVPDIINLHDRHNFRPPKDVGIAQVVKTFHQPHMGKLSVSRIISGTINDSDMLNGEKISAIFSVHGDKFAKVGKAETGDVVAFGRLEAAKTGDTLAQGKEPPTELPRPNIMPSVFVVAIEPENRSDEVKLASSLEKLCDEDPSLMLESNIETNQMLLRGQGDVHIQIAVERLKSKYGVSVSYELPKIPYKETIRKGKTQHSRYKKQSGGHGQFGDVVVEVKPMPPGSGFSFEQSITGGAIPKQYIPSVEAGVKDYLQSGPLGFPVVDVAVKLVDGSYHTVDSSDMAFKTAGRLAMSEAMPDCSPVLLEPIMKVTLMTPSTYTGQINGIVSARRGQILAFGPREGWPGWDTIETNLPQAELQDLIIEVRSVTQGSGTYTCSYDHLSELTGRQADQVLEEKRA